MKPPESIETSRLLLRLPTVEDAPMIFDSYAQDPEVSRYMPWTPHKSIQETEEFLSGCVAGWMDGSRFPYVITLKDTGELVGMIEMRIDDFKADVGYVIARKHWGKGIMTEALQKLVEWALNQSSIYRVWAICDVENRASARVMEKVGMQREGVLRRRIRHQNISDEPRDCFCYAIVK